MTGVSFLPLLAEYGMLCGFASLFIMNNVKKTKTLIVFGVFDLKRTVEPNYMSAELTMAEGKRCGRGRVRNSSQFSPDANNSKKGKDI